MWWKIAEVKEVWLAMVDTIATWQFIYNTIQKYLESKLEATKSELRAGTCL